MARHNPGNIKSEWPLVQWKGQIGTDDDGLCIFVDDHHGLMALCNLLSDYQTKYKLGTIVDIVDKGQRINQSNGQLAWSSLDGDRYVDKKAQSKEVVLSPQDVDQAKTEYAEELAVDIKKPANAPISLQDNLNMRDLLEAILIQENGKLTFTGSQLDTAVIEARRL